MRKSVNRTTVLLTLLLGLFVSGGAFAEKGQGFSEKQAALPAGSAVGKSVEEDLVRREVQVGQRVERLIVNGAVDVVFRQGGSAEPLLQVSALPDDWNNFKVDYSGGRLMLSLVNHTDDLVKGPVQVELELPVLHDVTLNGSGSFAAASPMEGKDVLLLVNGSGQIHCAWLAVEGLHARVNGSGQIALDYVEAESLHQDISGSGRLQIADLQGSELTATLNGSGRMSLAGRAANAHLELNGSGRLDADALEAGNVEATVAGSGKISCWAAGRLDGIARGSGSIRYKGTPEDCNISGNVRRK